MNELMIKTENLPDNPIELSKIATVGNAFVKSCQQQLKVIDSISKCEIERSQFLEKAQNAAIKLLDVYAKIGEVSKTIPARQRNCKPERDELGKIKKWHTSPSGEPPKWKKMGLKNKHELMRCQVVSNYPDLVVKIITEAIENDEIPTRAKIVSAYDKAEKYKKVAKMSGTETILKDLANIRRKVLNISKAEDVKFFNNVEKVLENMLKEIKDKNRIDEFIKNGPNKREEKIIKRLI